MEFIGEEDDLKRVMELSKKVWHNYERILFRKQEEQFHLEHQRDYQGQIYRQPMGKWIDHSQSQPFLELQGRHKEESEIDMAKEKKSFRTEEKHTLLSTLHYNPPHLVEEEMKFEEEKSSHQMRLLDSFNPSEQQSDIDKRQYFDREQIRVFLKEMIRVNEAFKDPLNRLNREQFRLERLAGRRSGEESKDSSVSSSQRKEGILVQSREEDQAIYAQTIAMENKRYQIILTIFGGNSVNGIVNLLPEPRDPYMRDFLIKLYQIKLSELTTFLEFSSKFISKNLQVKFALFKFGLLEKQALMWYNQHKLILQLLELQISLRTDIIYFEEGGEQSAEAVQVIQDLKRKHAVELNACLLLPHENNESLTGCDVLAFTLVDEHYLGYKFDHFKDPFKEDLFKTDIVKSLQELGLLMKEDVLMVLVSKGSINVVVCVQQLNINADYDILLATLGVQNPYIIHNLPRLEEDDLNPIPKEYSKIDSIKGFFTSKGPPNKRLRYKVPGSPWIKVKFNPFKIDYGGSWDWCRDTKAQGAWNQGFYCPYQMDSEKINAIVKNRILPYTTFDPYFMCTPSTNRRKFPGIYLYKDVNTILRMCPQIHLRCQRYSVAFSCRINPRQLEVYRVEGHTIYYTTDEIHVRPTAILLRPVE